MENSNVKALDDGYGDTKYASSGDPSLIPSFVTDFRPKPENEFNSNQTNHPYISTRINGNEYVVGEYAARLDSNIKWIGGTNKHSDKRFPILFKTSLGLMSSQSNEVVDNLVMSLPIKSETDDRKKLLNEIALGEHNLDLSFDGKVYFNRNIKVNNLIIKSQPFGSLCDVILDSKGQIDNKPIAQGFNVIVDIGARTLNILTVNALEEVPDLTDRTNDGMFTAYEEVKKYLESELNIFIPDGKLPSIIQNREMNNLDLSDLINKANENLAYNIKNTVEKLLINSWGFVTSIIFTGGGSQVLKPYLQKLFLGQHVIFLNRYSTVKGLKKYGIRQSLKSKENKTDVKVRVGNEYGR